MTSSLEVCQLAEFISKVRRCCSMLTFGSYTFLSRSQTFCGLHVNISSTEQTNTMGVPGSTAGGLCMDVRAACRDGVAADSSALLVLTATRDMITGIWNVEP